MSVNEYIIHILRKVLERTQEKTAVLKAELASSIAFENEVKSLLRKYGGYPEEATRIIFYKILQNGNLEEIKSMFFKVTQTLSVKVAFVDKFENPAKIDGKPVWELINGEALGALTVSEDGMSAEFMPKGPIGQCKVQVKADAVEGEETKEIFGELDLELIAGEAEVVKLTAEIK